MKLIGWLLILFLVIFSLFKGVLALVLYPLLYPFRTKIKTTIFNNSNVAGCMFRSEPLKPKGVARWVRPLWWFFDDSVSDVGGTWFVREKCKNDTGEAYDRVTENAFAVIGKEAKILDSKRRFCCAYRWSAIRNPLANFSYDILTLHDIKKQEVVYDSGKKGLKGYRIKTIEGKIDKRRTELGTVVYYSDNFPCIESCVKVGGFYIDFWLGFLSRSGRFELAFKPGIWKE